MPCHLIAGCQRRQGGKSASISIDCSRIRFRQRAAIAALSAADSRVRNVREMSRSVGCDRRFHSLVMPPIAQEIGQSQLIGSSQLISPSGISLTS